MNTRQKALRTGAIFIAVLIVAGLLLLYKGNDAVAIGMEKKEGILTAEQVVRQRERPPAQGGGQGG